MILIDSVGKTGRRAAVARAVNTETGEATDATVDSANGQTGFAELPAGNYELTFSAGDGYGETVGFCDGQDQSADLPGVAIAGSSVNLDLPADREYDCVTRTVLPADAAEEDDGQLAATFYACPAGMTFDDIDPSQCELITDGFDFDFQGDVEHPDLHLGDADFDGTTFVWSGLAVSADVSTGVSYSPIAYALPAGYATYALSTDGGPLLLPHAGGYSPTEQQPSFSVAVYFIAS